MFYLNMVVAKDPLVMQIQSL